MRGRRDFTSVFVEVTHIRIRKAEIRFPLKRLSLVVNFRMELRFFQRRFGWDFDTLYRQIQRRGTLESGVPSHSIRQ